MRVPARLSEGTLFGFLTSTRLPVVSSLSVVIQHALGSALGPAFVGLLSDRYGLEAAMATLPVFTLLAGVLFFVGSFFYVGDVAKVEAVALTANGEAE